MLIATPPTSDIVNVSATAGATGVVTVPAGRWLTATVQMCINVNTGATGTASLVYQTTDGDAAPADGSTIARVQLTGLTLTEAAIANTQEIFVYGGDPNGSGSTIDYVVSGTTSNSIVINGFLI
jgi:hypothetical protein